MSILFFFWSLPYVSLWKCLANWKFVQTNGHTCRILSIHWLLLWALNVFCILCLEHVLKKTVMFSAFSFANVLENNAGYPSLQLKKELCKVLEERLGGTEELLKVLFPQRRIHQIIFKYETSRGRKLSIEEWRTLCKRLYVELEFLARVQSFEIGRNPENIKTRKVWEVCKSYICIIIIVLLEFNFS